MLLICPSDRGMLSPASGGMACPNCNRVYPLRDGVVCLLDRPDKFYEGAFENSVRFVPRSEAPWHVWPLWLVTNGYLWAVRANVPPDSTVLELGCAGGVRYFGHRYRMVGCDLSASALGKLDSYACRVQADVRVGIPLPDQSVDAVVSSYFWEHISPQTKPRILSEIGRVLRPGGRVIFLYDVETANPLIGHYRKWDPARYEKLFLKGDGHLGYQSVAENLALFKAAELTVEVHLGLEKTWLQSPSVYNKLEQFPGSGSRLFAVLSRLGRSPFFYPYTALLRIVDALVCPWLPMAWARVCLVVCRKVPD